MAQVKVEVAPEDLFGIIGLLSLGQDPTQPLTPQQISEYTLLGRQYVETVLIRKRHDENAAVLALTQQRMASALSVATSEPVDEPTPIRPGPDDIQMADTGG